MKTAVQEVIELVKKYDNREIPFNVLLFNLELLLEKEKEQIIDAYEAAMERPIENYAEAYYNMNYNQDIKYTFENLDLVIGNHNNNLISTSDKKTKWTKKLQNGLTIYQSKLNKNE